MKILNENLFANPATKELERWWEFDIETQKFDPFLPKFCEYIKNF